MHRSLEKIFDRDPHSHKGDFGRALLVGGSRGMSGAIALSGQAALCSGAGLVTIATPVECQAVVAGFHPAYMTVGLPTTNDGQMGEQAVEPLLELVSAVDCVAIGPGLGRGSHIEAIVEAVFEQTNCQLVVDADGINALARGDVDLASAKTQAVLTPHPGEFRRLFPECDNDRIAMEQCAVAEAAKSNVVILLKGHRTLVTNGKQSYHNQTGNPGMATGGAGDVLTGVITGLLCQGLSPFDAARASAFVHGIAGDMAAGELGQLCMDATDILDHLPEAFAELESDPDGRGSDLDT